MFCLFQRRARRRDGGFGLGGFGLAARQQRRVDLLGAQAGVFLAQAVALFVHPAGALLRLLQHLGGGLGGGVGGRGRFGCLIGGRFRDSHGFGRGQGVGFHSVQALIVAGIGLGQSRVLGCQSLFGGCRVALQLFGVGKILPQLAQPAGRVAQCRTGPLFLRRDLLLRDAMAFQAGAGVGFLRPQRRKCIGGFGRETGGVHCGLRCQRGGRAGRFQCGAGDNTRGFGARALNGQKFGVGLSHEVGDIAEAIGLTCLTLQRAKLLVQLCAGVVGARQIGLGGAQLDLGFAAAGVQAGDAGGFLQHHAPVFRAGADQSANAPLADHGRGAGARGQIGE